LRRASFHGVTATLHHSTTIDCGDAENKVVFWATGEGQFKDELMDDGLSKDEWQYTGAYMIICTFGEGGDWGGFGVHG
jgi:hypothetical protein